MIGVYQGYQVCKCFGQNFLVDDGVIYVIVVVIDFKFDDVFVEIGLGLGVFIVLFMECVCMLQVVELDCDLVVCLQKCFGDWLIVYVGDVFVFDFGLLVEVGWLLCIVGNLLYNILSLLLFYLVMFVDCVCD